jgi:hypothetical protein
MSTCSSDSTDAGARGGLTISDGKLLLGIYVPEA